MRNPYEILDACDNESYGIPPSNTCSECPKGALDSQQCVLHRIKRVLSSHAITKTGLIFSLYKSFNECFDRMRKAEASVGALRHEVYELEQNLQNGCCGQCKYALYHSEFEKYGCMYLGHSHLFSYYGTCSAFSQKERE
jgi:hypothetical protein